MITPDKTAVRDIRSNDRHDGSVGHEDILASANDDAHSDFVAFLGIGLEVGDGLDTLGRRRQEERLRERHALAAAICVRIVGVGASVQGEEGKGQ